MRLMLLLYSVLILFGGLLAAGYCAVAMTSWQTFVSYNAPLGTEVTQEVHDTLEHHVNSLPKGIRGHGISFLSIPIEEECDWGMPRGKEYHGMPGGRWTFIAFGALMGYILAWVLQRCCFKRTA